jgi:uncharacterized protein (DUF302 family)/outer membrane murein-binding lipoprotein Lpp
MKIKNKIILSAALASTLLFSGCGQDASTPKVETPAPKAEASKPVETKKAQVQEDIRIYTADNSAGTITKDTVEAAFKANGFTISANNDMSLSFKNSFGAEDPTAGTDFKIYRLMPVYHEELSLKLIAQYPEFGLIAPISTSVYSKDGKEWSISTLSLSAMSAITGVPVDNADLVALYAQLTKALQEALPGGKFKELNYKMLRPDGELVTRFAFVLPNEDDDIIEAMETYEEGMEAEVETVGFVFPAFTDMTEALEDAGVETYDFYKTVSICNLKVIYPVHKLHPEAGAYAPCTMYKYKKKDEKFTRMGYPSVYNWAKGTEIEDETSLTPLIDAQNLLEFTIDSTIE